MNHPYIAADYVAALIKFAQDQGIHSDEIWCVNAMPSVLNGLMALPVMANLVSYLDEKTHDPCLGLKFGLTLDITQHGFLGYAAKSANNMLDAIWLDTKYLATRTNLISFNVLSSLNLMSLHLDTATFTTQAIKRFFCLTVLGCLARMHHDLSHTVLEAVFIVPFDIKTLKSFKHPLLSKIIWQQDSIAFRVDAPLSVAKTMIVSRDETLKRLLEAQCQASLPQSYELTDLVNMVRNLLKQQLIEPPTVTQLSHQLDMSERSLKRHLQQVGTSYRAVLNNIRIEVATQYLQETDLSIDDVCYRLGYTSTSTFKSQFKKWTGKTPKQMRLAKANPYTNSMS